MKKIILLILIALITACNGSENPAEPETYDIDCQITRIYNPFNIDITYNDNGLVDSMYFDLDLLKWSDKYFYEGTKLTKIISDGEEIEVKYENNKIIIEYIASRINHEEVPMKEISYFENERLVKRKYFNLEENLKSGTQVFNYKNNNIHNIFNYDKNGTLTKETIYHKYDNKKNAWTSIKNKFLYLFNSINLHSENNPLKKEIINYSDNDTTSIISTYQYTYNDDGYPITEILQTPEDTLTYYYDYICE